MKNKLETVKNTLSDARYQLRGRANSYFPEGSTTTISALLLPELGGH